MIDQFSLYLQHLSMSHHMEGESLIFNLFEVLRNRVVSTKLHVHQIIIGKARVAFFRSMFVIWTSLSGLRR